MRKVNRFFSIILLSFQLASVAAAQTLQQLGENLANSTAIGGGRWSAYAMYIESGRMLVDIDAHKNMVPASGLKLLTSAAALDILGADYRFKTNLYYTGDIKGGILQGDIIIEGGGDPTLGSTQMPQAQPLDALLQNWVQAIRQAGIDRIDGDIIADDHLYKLPAIPDFWNWRDMGNYYAAGAYALSINDNMFFLDLAPGRRVGDAVQILDIRPRVPDLQIGNALTTGHPGSGDNGYLYGAPGQYQLNLFGTIPGGRKTFTIKGALPEPPLQSAQFLKMFLEENGIKASGNTSVDRSGTTTSNKTLLHQTLSPTLEEIVFILNKRSVNLFAEHLVKAMAVAEGREGSTQEGINSIQHFLERMELPVQEFNLADGSGLSRTNTITTFGLTRLLRAMFSHKAFSAFYNSLGIAGNRDDIGFFGHFGRGTRLQNNARLKSGLLPRIRSHSGYLQDRAGRWIAFSLIANNYDGAVPQINALHLKMLKALADLK